MKYFHLSSNLFFSAVLGTIIPLVAFYHSPSGSFRNSINTNHKDEMKKETANTLTITSRAFNQDEYIPSVYTCEGKNINPPLAVKNIPEGAKSLAVIVDDPDAPNGTFVHWVSYNIPISDTLIENNEPGERGKNGKGATGYIGPCPPTGTHHYHFKVYALDIKPDIKEADKAGLEAAMQGHILASGELIGLYKKIK